MKNKLENNILEVFIEIFLFFVNMFFIISYSLILIFKSFENNLLYLVPFLYFFIIGFGTFYLFRNNDFKKYILNIILNFFPVILFFAILVMYRRVLDIFVQIASLKYIGVVLYFPTLANNSFNIYLLTFFAMIGYDIFFFFDIIKNNKYNLNLILFYGVKYILFFIVTYIINIL